MVSGELAGEGLQTGFSRHGLAPQGESSAGHGLQSQRAPKQCPANGVRRMLWGLVCRHGLLDTVKTHELIRPAVTYVVLLRVLRKINSPERQICNSAWPCLRHRKANISELDSDRGQISKKICNISENEFLHRFFGICNLFLRQQEIGTQNPFRIGVPVEVRFEALGNENAHQLSLHKLLNTARGPGHPGKNPGTSQIPPFETPKKTNLRGRARSFRPPPLRVEDPHPTGRSPDPKS